MSCFFVFYSFIPDFQPFCLTPKDMSALPLCWASCSAQQPLWRARERLCLWMLSCSKLLMGDGFVHEFWCLQTGMSCPDGWVGSGCCHVCAGEGRSCRGHRLIYPSCSLLKDQEVPLKLLCVPHWASGKVPSGCWSDQQLQELGQGLEVPQSGGASVSLLASLCYYTVTHENNWEFLEGELKVQHALLCWRGQSRRRQSMHWLQPWCAHSGGEDRDQGAGEGICQQICRHKDTVAGLTN